MNPLALMAMGLYGKSLPNQDGAPWRLVTPWKYGFKGAKTVVDDQLHGQATDDRMDASVAPRVRLLRERESRGRPSEVEPEIASAVSESSSGGRRCPSTGTPIR